MHEAGASCPLPEQDGQPGFVRRQQLLEIDLEWRRLVVADLFEDRDVLSKEPSRRPDDAPPACADDVHSKVHGQRQRKAWATEAIRQPVTTCVNSVAAGGPR